MLGTEMLKATEAAVVAHVSLRDVNRAIDEHILPDTFVSAINGRHVLAAACTLISFYFESAGNLTSDERLSTIRWAEPRLRRWNRAATSALLEADWIFRHDFLTIDLRPFFERTFTRLERLDAARKQVSVSTDVMGATPVIRGTRIPVHDVAAAMASGFSIEELVADYPSLTREKLDLAVMYAEANPLRGRPKPITSRLPEGTRIVSERRVPRRRAGRSS